LVYGKDDPRARNTLGTIESVSSITLDDLKTYFKRGLSPNASSMHVVGSLGRSKITASLGDLEKKWTSMDRAVTEAKSPPNTRSKAAIYFYDVPDAKQSVIRIGYQALAATDKDFYPATVMNYILGGGGFASRFTQTLREGKGYTYGINSGFSGSDSPGAFTISTGVRSNVTFESLQLIKKILDDFGRTYTDQDMATTKSFLTKSTARAFETSGAKLGMLNNISEYGWKPSYVKDRQEIVKSMTVDDIRRLAAKYLDVNKMVFLVVGDARTQMPRLKELGLGDPILINK